MNDLKQIADIEEYDLNKMIPIIKNKILNTNTSQIQLANATGIHQSRISGVLNRTQKGYFTIVQLVAIAKFFNCSVDELLGIETKEEKQDVTMADILDLLFQIDKKESLIIDYMQTRKRLENNGVDCLVSAPNMRIQKEPERVIGFTFKTNSFDKVIEAWKTLKDSDLPALTKYDIIKMWKEKTIETGARRSKSHDYKTSKEELLSMCKSILDNNDPIDYMGTNDYEALVSNIDSLKECFTDREYKNIKSRLEVACPDDTLPSWHTFDDSVI